MIYDRLIHAKPVRHALALAAAVSSLSIGSAVAGVSAPPLTQGDFEAPDQTEASTPLPDGARSLFQTINTEVAVGMVHPDGAPSPKAIVERFHNTLITTMRRADELGVRGRQTLLDDPVRSTFDFSRIAKLTVGRAWRDASADQRTALTEAFAKLSVATYAVRLTGFSGQSFETNGTEDGSRGTTLVKTHLVDPGKEDIALTYVMIEGSGTEADTGWRVVDVLLKGTISELSTKKSEYASVLKADGIDGLTAAILAQIETMVSSASES